MGRKRQRGRTGKGGGALSSLRGGFRSVAHGVTGQGPSRPVSRNRRVFSNVLTLLLLLVAAALLLRRFGFLRH